MYSPAQFRVDDTATLHALMGAHPLATVVVHGPFGIDAHHLPLLLDASRGVLRGHVARANPLWSQLASVDGPTLAIFHGPSGYVSPASYPSKQEHGKVVPTWNYAAVHAYGPMTYFDGEAELRALVGALTEAHEQRRARPWKVDDAPADFVAANLRAIVGIELRIERLEGKWKVSQNRNDRDAEGAAAAFDASGDAASATLIRARRPTR